MARLTKADQDYAETAVFHPADGKKPVKFADMTEEQRKIIRATVKAHRTNKHGADDPFPDGPVVMKGVELLEDHPDVGSL